MVKKRFGCQGTRVGGEDEENKLGNKEKKEGKNERTKYDSMLRSQY